MGELRITGGAFKGRKLKVSRGVRPTSARVREAIFNIIGDKVKDAVVLDLFAGSGALGLEALSRGALEAVFVEISKGPMEAIKQNISLLVCLRRARALRQDWERAIVRLAKEGMKFDLILADPPYDFWMEGDLGTKLLRLIADFDIVADNGILVIERSARSRLADEAPGFEKILEKSYGDSVLSFYRRGGVL